MLLKGVKYTPVSESPLFVENESQSTAALLTFKVLL